MARAPQVTSGRVVYSRTVQPANYESERAEVELAFVVEDGADAERAGAIAAEVLGVARSQVLAAVGPGHKSGGRAVRSGGRFSKRERESGDRFDNRSRE